MLLTLKEARAYARDLESGDDEILALVETAESLIAGGCGEDFDRESPKAKMLAKLYVADLNDERGVSTSAAVSRRELMHSLVLQLRTETWTAMEAGRC